MSLEKAVEQQQACAESSGLSEKDKLIRDFLKALKVTFKMSTIYKLDHPAFKKTVNDLMVKLESLFVFLHPLSIGFTPHSVFLDNRFWENDKIYSGLAQLFHFRKIKSLQISSGIPLEELLRFACNITLPVREFIKRGGAQGILKSEKIVHISAEVLDYSQLLRGEGEEIKDIWPYLLMEAVEEDDHQKLDQMAGSFDKVIGKFNTEELIQNEELHKNFFKFFQYLKQTSEEKHRACAKDLLKSILAGEKTPTEAKFENLKLLISDLNEQDLASTLWEEIIGNDKFDSLSFCVFSKIVSKERHKKIATSLRELFQTEDPANRKPEVETKLKILLSGTSNHLLSEIYRQTLGHLLQEITFEKRTNLDRSLLQRNYRFILLNRLDKEQGRDQAVKLLEEIFQEWETIAEDRDLDYLKCLLDVLLKKSQPLAGEPAYQNVKRALSEFVELLVLQGETAPALDGFVTSLKDSLFDRNVYLDKLFREKTVTPTLLRSYSVFFAAHSGDLKARLKQKSSDSRLLERIADGLKFIDSPFSLATLKAVYTFGDNRAKLGALKAMHSLTECDERFLFSALEKRDIQLKGEALVLLSRGERAKHVALSKLLMIQSPYGIRNKKLVRHIALVGEKKILDARSFLKALVQRKEFWYRRVRQEAQHVLEKWSEG